MRPNRAKAVPLIMTLPKIDFWYWCGHFIDLYRSCPYRCGYCNTQNSGSLKGIDLEPGLPEEKEVIGLGLLSDIFHPERAENLGVTAILRRLYDASYPVNIVTKSDRIVDAAEILKRFAKRDHVRVTITVLTLDDRLAGELEEGASAPMARLDALAELRAQGIPAGLALSPIIPGVNDEQEQLTALVAEAGKRGAGWFLFSGFDPVQSFLMDPRWRKSAELHGNADALRENYRRLKKLLVRLIFNEHLPMRVPRITLNLFNSRSSNRIVSECLFNMSYVHELMEHDVEMLRYRRAANEVSGMSTSLRSLLSNRKLGFIRGINPEIEKVIEEVLTTDRSSAYYSLLEEARADAIADALHER